jgi:hypothetical protein
MCQHYSTNNTKSREYEESIGQGPNPPSEISPGSPECRPRCDCLPPHGVTFFDPGDGLGALVDNGPSRETRAKVLMECGGGDCTRRHIDARLTFCGFAACFSSWVAEWTLDVTFNEDQSRLRAGHGARNMAVVRHFALNLVQQAADKRSIKRKRASWDPQYLLQILGPLRC